MKTKEEFSGVFAALRAILKRHASKLSVKTDSPKAYYLETKTACWKGKQLGFAAVVINKNYVSYHLVPVYASPKLVKALSPELKKRMQGKGCFNFTEVDKGLFSELKRLTDLGLKGFQERGWR